MDIPTPVMLVLGLSGAVSLVVAALVWRRHDPLVLKLGTMLVAFIPVVGPLLALWVMSFPDRMHPALQAKNRYGNFYSVPKAGAKAEGSESRGRDAV